MKSRIGIIGAGIHGIKILKALSFAHNSGEIELAALADINEDTVNCRTKEFNIKGYLDYKEMLNNENLNAVTIATPDFLHREVVLEAASRGIHIFVEKPLDTISQGAAQMVNTAKKNNVILFVDFHKRFDPAHMQLKEYILQGKLGKIQYGYAYMEDKIVVPSEWLKNWAQHSSPAWFLGIHFYDLVYWLIGSKPEKVFATAIKGKLTNMGIDTFDSIHAKLIFEDNIQFSIDTSWILPKSFPSIVNQGIRIIGSEGIMEVDSQDRGVAGAFENDESYSVTNPYAALEVETPGFGSVPHGYVFGSITYFVRLLNMIKSGIKIDNIKGNYPSGEEAFVSTQICEAVHESIKTGVPVSIKKGVIDYD